MINLYPYYNPRKVRVFYRKNRETILASVFLIAFLIMFTIVSTSDFKTCLECGICP
jgi:hypothetical protein